MSYDESLSKKNLQRWTKERLNHVEAMQSFKSLLIAMNNDIQQMRKILR